MLFTQHRPLRFVSLASKEKLFSLISCAILCRSLASKEKHDFCKTARKRRFLCVFRVYVGGRLCARRQTTYQTRDICKKVRKIRPAFAQNARKGWPASEELHWVIKKAPSQM